MLTGGRRLRPTARSSRWFRRLLRAALAWAVLDLVGAMSVAWCAPCVDATPRVPVRAKPSQPPFASQRPHKDYGPGTRHTWSSSTSWSKGKVMRCMLIARIYGGCGCVCCSVGGLVSLKAYVCVRFRWLRSLHTRHCARTERLVPYPFRARRTASPWVAAAGPVVPRRGSRGAAGGCRVDRGRAARGEFKLPTFRIVRLRSACRSAVTGSTMRATRLTDPIEQVGFFRCTLF